MLRRLKGPTNKSKYVTVLFTKTARIHSERILAVSLEILHTERDELALLSTNLFPFLFDHQNQLDEPSMMYCVT